MAVDGKCPSAHHAAFFLVGCTAAGKTAVAHAIARETGARVLSADSMLVYRGMDVGTAKPTAAEREGVVLRGVELADPDEPFSAGRWLEEARAAAREADASGKDLIVAGGTGLYVSALLRGIDAPAATAARRAELEELLSREGPEALAARAETLSPGSTATIDAKNPRRLVRLVEILEGAASPVPRASARAPALQESVLAGLDFPAEELNARIERRARAMFESGLLDEVRALCTRFPGFERSTAGAGIGYAEALAALRGEISVDEAVARTALRTRRLAKKQRTWWRHQARVEWVRGPADESDVARAAREVLDLWRKHGKAHLAI
jgi:tRNA dimethylallyltransferase